MDLLTFKNLERPEIGIWKKCMETSPIFVRATVRRYTCVLTSMSQRVDPSKFHERRKTDVRPF